MKVLKDKINVAIEHTLRKNNLFPETAHLLVAYSAGADSTCLAYALQKIGYKIAIAHANFQLRGSESDADAKFASEFAENLGLTYHERTFKTLDFKQQHKLGIQESARQLRYDWFEELRMAHSYHGIITAHHADDQAETMFFNFMRGAGMSGLRGIPKVNGYIIRPLLDISKKDIHEYLRKNKLVYREDSSNAETHYSRNFIRHEIFPLCEKIQPHFSETLSRSNFIYTETEQWLRFSAQKMLEHQYSQQGIVHKLDLKEARHWPGIHAAIYEWMRPMGFKSDVCRSISEAVIQGRNGCTFKSEQYEAMTFRQELHWADRKLMQTLAEMSITLEPGKSISVPGMDIHYKAETNTNTKNTLCIPVNQKDHKYTLRCWKPGDHFKPSGMHGKSKKISDFLNDIGWSPLQKKTCWLVCKENTIILIPGLRGSIYQIEQTEPAVGCWHFKYAYNI